MNAPIEPDDEGDLPLIEDASGVTHREFLAAVYVTNPTALAISCHIVAGEYVLSAEHPVMDLPLEEARQLHAALGDAIAEYEMRSLTMLDTEPEPMVPDLLVEEER